MQAAWQHLSVYSAFIPHGHCYLWKPGLLWLHILSDALTAIAYYSIPLTLIYFVRKRQDLPFDWMFQLFSAFIIACGSTHLIEIVTIWHPVYWLSGTLKAVTAGVSMYTAIALVPLVPRALSLPSPAQLEAVNRELEREILERKQVEETLRQSEARYRAVVEDQTELICRFLPNNIFTFVNDAYCRYFGKTPEELIGHSFAPVVYEEDLDLVKAQLNTLSARNPVVTITNRVITPDGRIRTHEWINRAIFDETGQCIELQAVGRDVTELKQTEAALQESQRFIQKITDTAPVLLYVFDLIENRNVYINREITELLGYTPKEIQTMGDRLLQNIIHPDDRALFPGHVQRWSDAGDNDIFQTEYRIKHSNGEWRYFQCQEILFTSTPENQPKQILGVAVDISDRKLTQQLQTALKEKEILLQEIHHRVKNNLQIIYSLLRLQRRKIQDGKAAETLLDSQNRVKTIALIHEKLYRSENFAEIALNQYIPSIIRSLFSAYQTNSRLIRLHTQIEDIPLDMDASLLCGLITNELVSNSLKYAFPENQPGEIFIEICLLNQDIIQLIFRDNGVGLPEDFDSTSTNSIGLKLVRDLVNQLQGELKMNGRQGMTFKITFPWRRS